MPDFTSLARQIKQWGGALGFQQVGITDTELSEAQAYLNSWLGKGYQGDMHWMARHGGKRTHPAELVPGTLRVISVRMDYLPDEPDPAALLHDPTAAFISRYALGRDYHKVLRKRLRQLAEKIAHQIGPFGYRTFVDSAPVMEKALAAKAGLGWIGKHSNLINREVGSWFFLGELYTDLPLPVDQPVGEHCGACTACLDCCPTRAIVAPYQVDARRCISYLTIELKGAIPLELRPLMGNRIYGCDDCQQCCPWNRFARPTDETDFLPRHGLDKATLITLFNWTETEFLRYTEGSAIRRIGYARWLRNIAVALGNAPTDDAVCLALQKRLDYPCTIVREHVQWAMQQHKSPGDWKFDAQVAGSFNQIAQREIPDYLRVIDLCIQIIRQDGREQPKIMDVGSATGETLRQLHVAGYRNLFGVDASADMLAQSFNQATLIHADTFPESYGPFDYVLNNWTLHFIHQPTDYLAAIQRALAPGGTLILTNKVACSARTHALYHDYKRRRGVSEQAIAEKTQRLEGVLVTRPLQWHLDVLNDSGFAQVEVINAHAAFVTFMAVKPEC